MASDEQIADLNDRYQDLRTRTRAGQKGLYRQIQTVGKELNAIKGGGSKIYLKQDQASLLADIGSRLGELAHILAQDMGPFLTSVGDDVREA